MDVIRVGSFLAELRKENNLTQQELGEKLGVTNKTILRWETGNYLPPVEMLEALSNMYGLTINEILSGRKLAAEEYREMAETNIRETLESSTFGLKDRIEFYRKKMAQGTYIYYGVDRNRHCSYIHSRFCPQRIADWISCPSDAAACSWMET